MNVRVISDIDYEGFVKPGVEHIRYPSLYIHTPRSGTFTNALKKIIFYDDFVGRAVYPIKHNISDVQDKLVLLKYKLIDDLYRLSQDALALYIESSSLSLQQIQSLRDKIIRYLGNAPTIAIREINEVVKSKYKTTILDIIETDIVESDDGYYKILPNMSKTLKLNFKINTVKRHLRNFGVDISEELVLNTDRFGDVYLRKAKESKFITWDYKTALKVVNDYKIPEKKMVPSGFYNYVFLYPGFEDESVYVPEVYGFKRVWLNTEQAIEAAVSYGYVDIIRAILKAIFKEDTPIFYLQKGRSQYVFMKALEAIGLETTFIIKSDRLNLGPFILSNFFPYVVMTSKQDAVADFKTVNDSTAPILWVTKSSMSDAFKVKPLEIPSVSFLPLFDSMVRFVEMVKTTDVDTIISNIFLV